MSPTPNPIKASPTAQDDTPLDIGMKNMVADALFEMGYDERLADILMQQEGINFRNVNSTRDIINDLVENYGESVLSGHLEEILQTEDTAEFRYDPERSWQTFKMIGFEKLVQHIITDPIQTLGLKIVDRYHLRRDNLTPELERVKQNLAIQVVEFGVHLPHVDTVIYKPTNCQVVAVLLCKLVLREYVAEAAYWKFKFMESGHTEHIKVYFITPDEDGTLTSVDSPKKGRAIVEVDLDGTYVMTNAPLDESNKVKLFEHFVPDIKQLIEGNR